MGIVRCASYVTDITNLYLAELCFLTMKQLPMFGRITRATIQIITPTEKELLMYLKESVLKRGPQPPGTRPCKWQSSKRSFICACTGFARAKSFPPTPPRSMENNFSSETNPWSQKAWRPCSKVQNYILADLLNQSRHEIQI